MQGGLKRPPWPWCLKKPSVLLGGQPVPQAQADPSHSLHASNTGRELRTQETGVGGLVRDSPDGREPKIDRAGAYLRCSR